MTDPDAKLIAWAIRWYRNISTEDGKIGWKEILIGADHYRNGADPLESAAAISEGRMLDFD